MAKIIRRTEFIKAEKPPVDTGRASKPEGSTGAGAESEEELSPSHQTYWSLPWSGVDQWTLVFPREGKLWRFLDRRAKRL